MFEYPRLILSDPKGGIFDHPFLKMAGRSGDRMVLPPPSELVPLPIGSQLFTLPGRVPIGWDEERGSFTLSEKMRMGRKEIECTAVAAFLPPGYIRTLLPATQLRSKAHTLPLWAYSSVGWKDGRFWATGLLIDPNPHWNPKYFTNDRLLTKRVESVLKKKPRESSLPTTCQVCFGISLLCGQERFFSKMGMSITHLSFMQCRLFGLHLPSIFRMLSCLSGEDRFHPYLG